MLARHAFGRTGHQSSRILFGGAALGGMRQDKADSLLPALLEAGVNHLDVAASYGDAELRIAPWLAAHPTTFFVATKTGERTGDGARAELERSLTRMGVDRVDLIQLHNLVEDDEWETAFAPGGAVEALAKARDEGLIDHIGVTGHGLRIAGMHLRSLERFDFASVLLPWSPVLSTLDGYRADVEALRSLCAERGVAVQTIKSAARRRWQPDHEGHRFSWYEPITDPDAVGRAVRWVLAQPDLFVNSSSDARILPYVLAGGLASAAGEPAPREHEVLADVEAHDVEPLFDGADLERI